jgi:hypothetical protein
VEAVVTIATLIRIHTFLRHVRPCHCATQIIEDVLVQSMPDPTFGCVNEHELMMCVCLARKLDLISDKPIAVIADSILVNTTNDPTLITNHNHPASVDTIIVFGYNTALARSVCVNDDTMCR